MELNPSDILKKGTPKVLNLPGRPSIEPNLFQSDQIFFFLIQRVWDGGIVVSSQSGCKQRCFAVKLQKKIVQLPPTFHRRGCEQIMTELRHETKMLRTAC